VRAARPFKNEDAQEQRRLKDLTMAASGIAVKSPQVRDEPRTWSEKPDPKGDALIKKS
jgi:hypothetical protein